MTEIEWDDRGQEERGGTQAGQRNEGNAKISRRKGGPVSISTSERRDNAANERRDDTSWNRW